MKSIIYVGMDVHSSNYTLTSYMVGNDNCFATVQVEPDYKNILKYLEKVQENMGTPCEFHCGYEAGCLGYVLYHQLRDHACAHDDADVPEKRNQDRQAGCSEDCTLPSIQHL